MAYKQSDGTRNFGDIKYEGDAAETQIDFEDDFVALKTGGNQVLVVSGSVVGIGTATPDPDELLTIDGNSGDHEANIQFREDGANRAKIGVNDSDNLVFHNQTANKHIVFKVNDQGTTREGLRLDGATTAVVVNEGSESLVDFRVESDSNTHMLFVDGSENKIGIGTDAPDYTLDVAGDIGVDQYIYHNGDADTLIQFVDDKIVLKAGNRALVTAEIKNQQPHEVTINDGSNNVDFVVKGNGSNEGNPLFKCDASTGRVGINGVGSPDCELHVAGDVKLHGDAPEITVRRDDNADASTIQFQGSGGVVGAYVKFLGDESGAGGTNNDLALGTGATVTERMRIRGDGNVGIGTSAPSELLAINAQSDGDECFIQFQEGGADRAKIGINTSNNFLIHNQFMNKHIVFKVNDQGNTREALRIDGAVSEVVVNQSSESLVDFRVESDNNTHMVFVDGSTDTVGINTSTPKCSLSVAGSMAMNITGINSGNDPGTTYSVAATDCVILVNTRPTAQGGIDSAITITLPDAASFPGRVITIKDSAGYCDVNAITISRAGSDTINGVDATVSLPTPASFKTLISDGSSSWQEIGN